MRKLKIKWLHLLTKKENSNILTTCFNLWDARKSYIFRAFQALLKPQVNLAETIHAGMVHLDTMGVSLLESIYYDIMDNLLFYMDDF